MKHIGTKVRSLIRPRYGLISAALCCIFSGAVHAQNSPGGLFGQSPVPLSLVSPGTENARSSPDNIWGNSPSSAPSSSAVINVQAINARQAILDVTTAAQILSQAPIDRPGVAESGRPSPTYIYLPAPDGGYVQFSIRRSQILSPEMEEQYPGITTYRGYAVNDPATTLTLDMTPSGFHAQVLQPGNRWFIDPQYKGNTERYVSYYKARKSESRQCVLDSSSPSTLPRSPAVQSRSGDMLRSYALAVATTGEYTQFFGDQAAAVAAIVTTVTRVTGIYEKELAVTFTIPFLSPYTDPATDPFTGNNNANVLINESQLVIDANSVATGLSYDIGHTFSTGAGGLAGLGVVCNTTQKARGVTGLSNPTGDVFDVDFVAHEIGHQFGGNHTFNGTNGACTGGNRNGGTAYEPGSGSTIQAYAGICGADNLQSNSDAIMHSISHEEMIAHVTFGSGANCGTVTPTGNSIPVPDTQGNYAMPHSTPFALLGSGTDANADPLTYLWEQDNLGPQAALSAPDDGQIPLFRVLTPSPSPARFMPEYSLVASNTSSTSEKLPTVGRNLGMSLTARDGQGGYETDFMNIIVDGTAGPFVVTSPNGGETVSGNTLITWDVAGTDGGSVLASNVDILMSLTGGATAADYSESLLLDTPNDGSELVDLSAYNTSAARILIADTVLLGHTFYDISDGTFTVDPPLVLTCNGLPVDVDLNLGQSPTSGADVIYGTPASETISGLGGNDTICGGDGFDTIYGNSGNDTLFGGDSLGNDTSYNDLFGGTGSDELHGGIIDQANFLYGQGGGDFLYNGTIAEGGSGGDLLDNSFRTSSSTMKGGGNNDSIYGGDGVDTMNGGPGLDYMDGGPGDDVMAGGNARDTMYGSGGNDTMTGGAANDFMFGNAGDDNISGNQGNDQIDGGPHVIGDTCNGGGQTTSDTEVDCEITSGFPAPPAAPPAPLVREDGRTPLTDAEILVIDRCDLTVEECLRNTTARR